MNDSTVLSHFHKKQAWMASHVESAQFPTAASKEGLRLYKVAELVPASVEQFSSGTEEGFTFYEVDCHPLMVRYAKILAQKWPESERETMMEYLSQISLTDLPTPDGMHVGLYVAMEQGTPVATGMLLSSEESDGKIFGIYDVYGLNKDASNAIKQHLLCLAGDGNVVSE
ncbi:hypothetical protein [Grimontia sp. NTOU-MAR1]|uniref:hypothetical protein n=1 Tax=Grimontia sp. NTOU-MAR1 TaxID=3111011 RepID=UPI002DBA49B2|nr:hypothetical protein [Grimontia sp. NTOU-MAR1]WRW00107.1 hypothetical protein VP504_24305 [Grimontia sp. NTOU-MAR1]